MEESNHRAQACGSSLLCAHKQLLSKKGCRVCTCTAAPHLTNQAQKVLAGVPLSRPIHNMEALKHLLLQHACILPQLLLMLLVALLLVLLLLLGWTQAMLACRLQARLLSMHQHHCMRCLHIRRHVS